MNPAGSPEIAWPAIAAVALVTAVATLAHWWLKRRGLIPTAANPIKVVATRSLGGKRAIAIIEVESERFLLGLTDESISCLSPLASEAKPTGSTAVVSLTAGRGRA